MLLLLHKNATVLECVDSRVPSYALSFFAKCTNVINRTNYVNTFRRRFSPYCLLMFMHFGDRLIRLRQTEYPAVETLGYGGNTIVGF